MTNCSGLRDRESYHGRPCGTKMTGVSHIPEITSDSKWFLGNTSSRVWTPFAHGRIYFSTSSPEITVRGRKLLLSVDENYIWNSSSLWVKNADCQRQEDYATFITGQCCCILTYSKLPVGKSTHFANTPSCLIRLKAEPIFCLQRTWQRQWRHVNSLFHT